MRNLRLRNSLERHLQEPLDAPRHQGPRLATPGHAPDFATTIPTANPIALGHQRRGQSRSRGRSSLFIPVTLVRPTYVLVSRVRRRIPFVLEHREGRKIRQSHGLPGVLEKGRASAQALDDAESFRNFLNSSSISAFSLDDLGIDFPPLLRIHGEKSESA